MATKAVETLFLDTNVLVFANIAEAPLHRQALAAIKAYQEQGCRLWVSSQVLREYLAVRTRGDIFGGASDPGLLVERVKFFLSAFSVAYDTPATVAKLLDLIAEVPMAGKQIHDAHIVATMLAHDIRHLLTDNVKDFKRFSSHIAIVPLSG